MDYSKIYIELIERANGREVEGYTEKHHIVPRCMGGDNNPRNIAILTPEEHYVAHQLLAKIYPDNRQLIHACQLMTTDSSGRRVNNKLYGWIKTKLSKSLTGVKRPNMAGANHPNYGKYGKDNPNYGKKRTEEFKRRHSLSFSGDKNPMFGRVGELNPMFGRVGELNPNYQKFGAKHAQSKKVLQFDKNKNLIKEWDSSMCVVRELGLTQGNISSVCSGKSKTAGGFIWEYK